jgi:phospholipase C
MGLDLIKHIVVVMMENRSFDNMLGYLSLPPHSRADVEGLGKIASWEDAYASVYKGDKYRPFVLTDPYRPIDADPPHERDPIALQLGSQQGGKFAMDGFVANYATAKGATPPALGTNPPVMGYFTADQVPVADFFAREFLICDHWFSALPAGTQPNRLMAMSGNTRIDVNTVPLPQQYLVYDWLSDHGIKWRVYHEELPFYAMMLKWAPRIFDSDHFRPLEQLSEDMADETPDEFPSVIFIEPAYTDAPHLGVATDDRAPSAVKGGQEFLQEVYRDVTSDPDKWGGTVLIVTYDEHGGFFDHVSPPAVRTDPPDGVSNRPFETLGVRVPAFIISPFVKQGSVFNGRLDHTSILKFIGQKFERNGRYSADVDARPVGSVLDALDAPEGGRTAPVIGSLEDYLSKEAVPAGRTPGSSPVSVLQSAFQRALDEVRASPGHPTEKIALLLAAFPPKAGGEMTSRVRCLLPLLALSIFYGCAAGTLTPSRHNTEEYNNAFAAASQGDLVKLQADVQQDPALLRATEWDGMTLLHDAVDKSQKAIVQYLLSKGADVSVSTKDGRTPLHIAAQHGDVVMISLLLDHGAAINPVDEHGMTPLDRATKWGHVEAKNFLRARGGRD